MTVAAHIETWEYTRPFRITRGVRTTRDVVVVTLRRNGFLGAAEAAGVSYRGESCESIIQDIVDLGGRLTEGTTRQSLRRLLPPGGALNALDCALWDLEASEAGKPVWALAGIYEAPRAIRTVFTCGAGTPDEMAAEAVRFRGAEALKIKLTGETCDAARVKAVRAARPDVWLAVDANQGWTPSKYFSMLPVLEEARVSLLEQPFEAGRDHLVDQPHGAIEIFADESIQTVADMQALRPGYSGINIKLDKCGGLTGALPLLEVARKRHLKVMVGNMGGSSLAMAPAFVLAQSCDYADLDGPALLTADRRLHATYDSGNIFCPSALWGAPGNVDERVLEAAPINRF